MLESIARPFGWLMLKLYDWLGNYGVAVILFALLVKLILLPFQLKSKKSTMRMSRMTPRLKELEKKFGNDQQRYQMEMQKLYKEEGVNPMSGCLWSLIPFPILLALYRAIRFPLTTMMGVDSSLLEEGGAIYEKLMELGYTSAATNRTAAYEQIFQSKFITENFDAFAGLSDKLQTLSYKFLGLDLGSVPQIAFWKWDWSSAAAWGPSLGLFMIPVVAALLSWLSMKIANASNPQAQANQQNQLTMLLIGPLMSIWICFAMPAVMGIYWIAQYVFGIFQELILNRIFNKQLDAEDADRIEREKLRAAELEAKRQETERLKAEGATTVNKNTSRKKQQAAAAQKEAERKAAEVRSERAAKRAAMGLTDDIPASQVGNRRYARGRAYVPDRYTNPEEAEEKTILAAEESDLYAEEHPAPEADGEDAAAGEIEDTAEADAPDQTEEDEPAEADAEADEDENAEEPAEEAGETEKTSSGEDDENEPEADGKAAVSVGETGETEEDSAPSDAE